MARMGKTKLAILIGVVALGFHAAHAQEMSALDSLKQRHQEALIDLLWVRESLRTVERRASGGDAIDVRAALIGIDRQIRRMQPSLNIDSLQTAFDRARQERRARIDALYAGIEERIERGREARKADLEEAWGSFWESKKSFWVERQDDRERVAIDFEEGVIEAQVRTRDSQEAISDATEQLVAVFREATATLEDQLPSGLRTASGVREASRVERDSEGWVRVALNAVLLPTNIPTRAQKYLSMYQAACDRYGVDLALALAVGRSESGFFSKAISRPHRGGHSYGMMQIVHRWAGSEYLSAHPAEERAFYEGAEQAEEKDSLEVYIKEFWFDARRNIDAGVWFLSQLARLDLIREREHKAAQRYLQVCSYNAGSGRVSRSLVQPLGEEIDAMEPEPLLRFIVNESQLPEETRNYLGNVERFRSQYLGPPE